MSKQTIYDSAGTPAKRSEPAGKGLVRTLASFALGMMLTVPAMGQAQASGGDSPAAAIAARTQATLAVPASRNQIVTSSDGTRIAVYEYGPDASVAPTVVLVHGYPDTAKVWDQVVARLAPGYHVVTYDTRGSGNSDHPSTQAAYKLSLLSADLGAVLDATAGGRKVHLVGHDWGAVQSWESVAKTSFAGRIASYTSISGPSVDLTGQALRRNLLNPLQWGNLVQQAIASAYIVFFNLPLLPEIAWALGLPEALLQFTVFLEGGTREPYASGDGAAAVNLYRANVTERLLAPTYDRIAVENVQIIVPTRDAYVKESTATDLGSAVRYPLIRRIDAGHWVELSHPDEIAQLIGEFADTHEF